MMLPTISVIIPTLNAADMVERALASVFAQEYPALEVLVLDGGSTDNTQEIIRRYQDRIAFWRSSPGDGAVAALREGTERASGDVVVMLSADDWVTPGALVHVGESFAHDPELDVLTGGVRIVDEQADGRMVTAEDITVPEALALSVPNILRRPLTHGRFFRRRVYEKIGWYDLSYRRAADLEFLLRACLADLKSATLSQVLYVYRWHRRSATLGTDRRLRLKILDDNLRIAEQYLSQHRLKAQDRVSLRAFHGRHAARLILDALMACRPSVAVDSVMRAIRQNPFWLLLLPCWSFGWLIARLFGRHASGFAAPRRER